MKNKNNQKDILCSFCGTSQDKIDFLVEGIYAYICNLCIEKAKEAVALNYKNKTLISKCRILICILSLLLIAVFFRNNLIPL